MNLTVVEWVANLLNILCVYLILKNNIWNWAVGIANCLLYIVLFYPAKLYGDVSLQVIYITLSVFGIYKWFKKESKPELPITKCTKAERSIFQLLFVSLAAIIIALLSKFTNTDVPVQDGITTALCLTATVMMAHRKVEHWYYWIISNIGFIWIYNHKSLPITMWFQIPLIIFSLLGLVSWNLKRSAYEIPQSRYR